MRKHKGFTLIEMMIVILVIAVLATIVGLAVRNVGSDARASKAAADVKILNTASTIYQNDTGVAAASQAVLVNDTITGWDGPYIDEEVTPPAGWSYSVTDGHWTASET